MSLLLYFYTCYTVMFFFFFFFQAEDGIRDVAVTGVQTCALPISPHDREWVFNVNNNKTTSDQSCNEFPPAAGGVCCNGFHCCAGSHERQFELQWCARTACRYAGVKSRYRLACGQDRRSCGWRKNSNRGEEPSEGSCRKTPRSTRPLCRVELQGRYHDFPLEWFHARCEHQKHYSTGFRIHP